MRVRKTVVVDVVQLHWGNLAHVPARESCPRDRPPSESLSTSRRVTPRRESVGMRPLRG